MSAAAGHSERFEQPQQSSPSLAMADAALGGFRESARGE